MNMLKPANAIAIHT